MKSWEYEAVTYDGAVYCTDCLPQGVTPNSEGAYPVFADQEWDYAPSCDQCGHVHDYMVISELEGED